MKRSELIRRIATTARRHGLTWEFVREGGDHEIWELDGQRVTIPRHREVGELTSGRILRDLEPRFGKRWWRP
jgi:hypothetical protein